VECRHGGRRRERGAAVYRKHRPAGRHVDASWPAIRSDTEDGATGSAWWNLEAARIRRLGPPSGDHT